MAGYVACLQRFYSLSFQCFIEQKSQTFVLQANSDDPDQMPYHVASDMTLHWLPMSHEKDAILIWVNI